MLLCYDGLTLKVFIENTLDGIHIKSNCNSWNRVKKESKEDMSLNFSHVLFAVLLEELLRFEVDHPKNGENIWPLLKLTKNLTD